MGKLTGGRSSSIEAVLSELHNNEDGYTTPLIDKPGNLVAEGKNDITFGQLLRHHRRDWLIVLIVAVVEVVVYAVIPPFHHFVGQFNIDDFRYPRRNTTVPTWSVMVIAVFIPLLVFSLFFVRRRNVRDFHDAFLGLAVTLVLTALLTDSIKNTAGMPRPDFFYRCFPDLVENYEPVSLRVICHGSANDIKDGYKSSPSGHSSCSFAGLGYLSMYLVGKLGVFDKRGFSSRTVFVFLPLLAATLVAVSRVGDHQHRWSDVIFGAVLGLAVAYMAYRSHFPSFYADNAGFPHAYIPGIELHSSVPTGPTRQELGEDGPALKSGGPLDLEAGRLYA